MRTSHAIVKNKVIKELKEQDQMSFLSSEQCRAYLVDRANQMISVKRKKIQVIFLEADSTEKIAYTNGKVIYILPANKITLSFSSLRLKHLSMLGLVSHEMGHVLYSNFTMLHLFQDAFQAGNFYPHLPDTDSFTQQRDLEEIKIYLKSDKEEDHVYKRLISFASLQILNCLEDAYIESCMCYQFPGDVCDSILLNQMRLLDQSKSIEEMALEKVPSFCIMLSLVLQYARQGEIYNPENYKGEYVDVLYKCIPHIDASIYSEDIRDRFSSSHQIFLLLWKYAKEYVNDIPEEDLEKELSSLSSTIPSDDEEGTPMECTGYFDHEEGTTRRNELSKVVSYEQGKRKLKKTSLTESLEMGEIYEDPFYTGSGYQSSEADLYRLLSGVAEERVGKYMEEELTEELQEEADKLLLGNAHLGETICIRRMSEVPEKLMESYQKIYPSLKPMVEKLKKEVSKIIESRKRGGKLHNRFQGNHFEARKTYRKNGAYFSKKYFPTRGTNLAVAVLVDESGSMSSGDRITCARAASMVLEAFCRELAIPCMIAGHSYDDEVKINSYVAFHNSDHQDRFRIMDMSASGCNRDGAALRFVAEQLIQRREKYRVLLLLSDGQPSAPDYEGTAAEADLRGIKKEYEKKGIHLLAGAIGDDLHELTRIYGDSFVDLTDVKKLPTQLTKLLIPYIKEDF